MVCVCVRAIGKGAVVWENLRNELPMFVSFYLLSKLPKVIKCLFLFYVNIRFINLIYSNIPKPQVSRLTSSHFVTYLTEAN